MGKIDQLGDDMREVKTKLDKQIEHTCTAAAERDLAIKRAERAENTRDDLNQRVRMLEYEVQADKQDKQRELRSRGDQTQLLKRDLARAQIEEKKREQEAKREAECAAEAERRRAEVQQELNEEREKNAELEANFQARVAKVKERASLNAMENTWQKMKLKKTMDEESKHLKGIFEELQGIEGGFDQLRSGLDCFIDHQENMQRELDGFREVNDCVFDLRLVVNSFKEIRVGLDSVSSDAVGLFQGRVEEQRALDQVALVFNSLCARGGDFAQAELVGNNLADQALVAQKAVEELPGAAADLDREKDLRARDLEKFELNRQKAADIEADLRKQLEEAALESSRREHTTQVMHRRQAAQLSSLKADMENTKSELEAWRDGRIRFGNSKNYKVKPTLPLPMSLPSEQQNTGGQSPRGNRNASPTRT